jgi:peptidyl-prolyl cis-trans isomerase A (cyclophilin A)
MADDREPTDRDNPRATLHTNYGDVTIELFEERTPRTVENFLGLATGEQEWEDPETGETVEGEPLYDDVAFHRVIEGFMVQTGDPTGTGRGGPGYTFDDEFHPELRHDGPGVVSMANSGPDTNGSQFFITLDAQPHLDDRHAVFGQVVGGSASEASGASEAERSESSGGMDVVEEIGGLATDANDNPTSEATLESVDVDR